VNRSCLVAAGWLFGALSACAGAGTSSVVPSVAAKAEAAPSVQVCAEFLTGAKGLLCVRPLSVDEQRHREVSYRLESEHGRVTRRARLNGRGFAEPDDKGCSEHRYRFDGEYMAETIGYRPDGVVCERVLYSERATRASFVDAWGRPEFNRERLNVGARYARDAMGLIVNVWPLAADGSATTIMLASELRNERDALGNITRTCFFDAQGKPIKNSMGVHCRTFRVDEFGSYVEEGALDEQGRAVSVSEDTYQRAWQHDAYGNLVRSTALAADGKPVSATVTWCPVQVLHRDAFGFLLGKDCLDGAGRPSHFDEGNASWRATPDQRGRAREYRYFDGRGNLFESSFGYARIELDRDSLGHVTERRYFRGDGSPGQDDGPAIEHYDWSEAHLIVKRTYLGKSRGLGSFKGCASLSYEHDEFRQQVRQTCRDYDGKPARSRENISTTVTRWDARGLVAEVSYLDAAGKVVDSRSGYARKLYSYDPTGTQETVQHSKANGGELDLRRYAVLNVKPPHADGFWPAPSRAAAVARIEKASRELAAGMPWMMALQRFGNDKVYAVNPGDTGFLSMSTVYPAARDALEPLRVGEYSRIVELPYGLLVYRRTQ
jgi:hypothetical protein